MPNPRPRAGAGLSTRMWWTLAAFINRSALRAPTPKRSPPSVLSVLVDAGLVVYADEHKPHRLILNAIVRAEVPLAYGVVKPGRTKIDDRYVFALPPPSDVLEADGKAATSIVVWRGGTQYGRVRQGGKREGWISEVAAPAAKVPLAMAAIGTMLSGPALPYLPEESESNTMEHLVGESGGGKTTIVRVGASVHGKGSQTTDPDSYLESYKNTINASENILLAHNHLGVCFDELKNIEQKAAATFAYDFGAGRRKGRITPTDRRVPVIAGRCLVSAPARSRSPIAPMNMRSVSKRWIPALMSGC